MDDPPDTISDEAAVEAFVGAYAEGTHQAAYAVKREEALARCRTYGPEPPPLRPGDLDWLEDLEREEDADVTP